MAQIFSNSENLLEQIRACVCNIAALVGGGGGVLATEATLASMLVELQGINLDTNNLNQEGTQALVLAELQNVSSSLGLTVGATIDLILAELQLHSTALSGISASVGSIATYGAKETTLQSIERILGASQSPIGLFSCRFTNSFESYIWDVVNNGTATGTQNNSYIIDAPANADYRVLQTFQRFGPNDTDSLSIHLKFSNINCLFGNKWIGWGQVDTATNYLPYEGIFFYCGNSQAGLSINVLGSTVDNILQQNWNIDPLDGLGPSGVIADWTGSHHLIIDIIPRYSSAMISFMFNGIKVQVHLLNYTNLNLGSSQFNSYQAQPINFGHINLNPFFQADSFTVSAVNVLANSSEYNFTKPFSLNTGVTVGSAALIANTYPIFTFRFKSGMENTVLKLLNLSFTAVGANDSASLVLLVNPTLSGAIAYTSHNDGPIEYHYNNTGAITVSSLGYEAVRIINTKDINTDYLMNIIIALGKGITGTRNTFCLAINPRNNNVSYVASLNLAYNI